VNKIFQECDICGNHFARKFYFPFRSENKFSVDLEDEDVEDSMKICRSCEYMISQIRRCDELAFCEATTIADVRQVVREGLKS
jgi:hypothetical protein